MLINIMNHIFTMLGVGVFALFIVEMVGNAIDSLKEKIKEKSNNELIRSNIIQFDSMGYPLMLCIKGKEQVWIDISVEYANKGLGSGTLHILEWDE